MVVVEAVVAHLVEGCCVQAIKILISELTLFLCFMSLMYLSEL